MELTQSQLDSLLYALPHAIKSLQDLSNRAEREGSILMPLMLAQTIHDLREVEHLVSAERVK